MPKRPKPESKKNFNLDDLTIGDRIVANLHHGGTEEAIIKAIIGLQAAAEFRRGGIANSLLHLRPAALEGS